MTVLKLILVFIIFYYIRKWDNKKWKKLNDTANTRILELERELEEYKKSSNKVHFYVARDKDGDLWLYIGKPFRDDIEFYSDSKKGVYCLTCNIEDYGLRYKDYDYLKWEDEPVEVFLNLED